MRSIRLPRIRPLLLVALCTSRRDLHRRQSDGNQGSNRAADVLTVGSGEIAEKSTRCHRLMERLLLHGARAAQAASAPPSGG